MSEVKPILSISGVTNRFGQQRVHDAIDLDIPRGEIIGLIGGSGSGKSVLLKTMAGLHRPNSGTVMIDGQTLASIPRKKYASLFGMLFQQGALFSSLTVAENIMLPLKEHTKLPRADQLRLAAFKLKLVGLGAEVGKKYPSELSGGMTKRVSLARALALDPPILFLDEPTAGLDPVSAHAFDQMILMLNRTLGVTIVMVTHDLDTLFGTCTQAAALIDRQILMAPLDELLDNPHPWLHEYLHGPRARGAMLATEETRQHHGE